MIYYDILQFLKQHKKSWDSYQLFDHMILKMGLVWYIVFIRFSLMYAHDPLRILIVQRTNARLCWSFMRRRASKGAIGTSLQ